MAKPILRRVSCRVLIGVSLVLILPSVVSSIGGWKGESTERQSQPIHVATEDREQVVRVATPVEPKKFGVTIRRPAGPPLIALPQPDPLGRVGKVTCSTCHSIRAPNRENRKPSDLKEFHQDMPVSHGELACYACHNPADSDTLRLADESAVEYADVMKLCAQCHGTHARYYARGLHGGMSGYWDLSRGGRVRNNCIDCHDPHVPKFPKMQPTFQPRDRFLTPSRHEVQWQPGNNH